MCFCIAEVESPQPKPKAKDEKKRKGEPQTAKPVLKKAKIELEQSKCIY